MFKDKLSFTESAFPNVSFTFHVGAPLLLNIQVFKVPVPFTLNNPTQSLWEPRCLDNTGALLRRDLMDTGSQPVSGSHSPTPLFFVEEMPS